MNTAHDSFITFKKQTILMKKLILLLLLLPLTTFAQKEISKKPNCIIITNNNTAYANFTDVRLLLTKMNIEIANLDKDRFQIKTGTILVKDSSIMHLDFDCRDYKITISGLWKPTNEGAETTSSKDNYIRIEDGGTTDTLAKAAFEKMKELAKKFGTALTYEYAKYLP